MNNIYDLARRELLNAQMNWPTIELLLVAFGGTPDFDPLDISLGNIKARSHPEMGSSLPINGTTVAINGTAQTDQVLIPGIPVGPPVTWFVMCRKHATVHDSSKPILFLDDVYQLPFVPNGLDLVIQPDWLQWRGWWRP